MRTRPLILFVDDDPMGQEVLEAMLGDEDYELASASNGHEALAKAQQLTPDLILLDVMMLGLDGFEVLRRLRADPVLAEAPVILVTALHDRGSRLAGLAAGADDFVSKPIDRLELQARVRTVTRLNRFRGLLAERAKFEWAVESAEDGHLMLDAAGQVLYANPRARALLGAGDAPASFRTQCGVRYRSEPAEAWQDWPAPEVASRYLVRPESKTAPALWLQVETHPAPSGSGVLVRLKDVTAALQHRREMWAFHSAVSHKLRTPVAAMLPSLELIAADDLAPAARQRLARTALASAQRLASEIQQVMDFLEVARRPWSGVFGLGELPSLARAIADGLGPPPLSIRGTPEAWAASVGLTAKAVELSLVELLHNARKFHPRCTPAVEIDLALRDGFAWLRVQDDGLHLTPEQLRRALDPYYQGERDHTGQIAGMGLGLSMVAAILWSTGGSCRLHNRADAPGVVAELGLPLVGR
jgi:DNA-binding response OmpR family regulator